MMYRTVLAFYYRIVMCFSVIGLCSSFKSESLKPSLSSSIGGDDSSYAYGTSESYEENALSTTPHILEDSQFSTSLWPSYPPSVQLHKTTYTSSSPEETYMSSVPEYYPPLYSEHSEIPVYSSLEYSVSPTPTTSSSVYFSEIHENNITHGGGDNSYAEEGLSPSDDFKHINSGALINASPYQHFHTPLMSLLVASPSLTLNTQLQSSAYRSDSPSFTLPSSYNESISTELTTVPADYEHKKVMMIVLRAEDCSKLSKLDFENMLGKLLLKFGFGEVVPQISNAQCHSHLHINLTLGSSAPTLRFFPDMDDRNNVTVDVFNRTFRIVKVEKIDLKLGKAKSANTSTHVITKIAKHESVAYIIVGVSFGLVLVICVSVCCIKICCLHKNKHRFVTNSKCSHMRLRPEDYTLTPIPRPASLYMDYYRGSLTADIFSTTSAGSITSTPTVEQGVVQPFDTSIVPLEDTATIPLDSSRDPSVESMPSHSSMKTFSIQGFNSKSLLNSATDSKERLNPKQASRRAEFKPKGVANPTFQRY